MAALLALAAMGEVGGGVGIEHSGKMYSFLGGRSSC
jgi:hypothetical protein